MEIDVCEIGGIARGDLRGVSRLTVAAVFERSVYLRAKQAWLCLGPAGLGAGPLNARCRLPGDWDWRTRVAPGDEIGLCGPRLGFGPGLGFSFSRAATWEPAHPPAADRGRLGTALAELDRETIGRVPAAGLGRLGLCAAAREHAAREAGATAIESRGLILAAAGAAADLDYLLRAEFEHGLPPCAGHAEALTSLLGLGPGLTPSGDDFLGGALIALDGIGARRLSRTIWRQLEPLLGAATHDISAAHLAAAARGAGSAALHALLHQLLAGRTDRIARGLDAVDAIGHTSGWDALAGALRVLRAWQAAKSREGAASSAASSTSAATPVAG